MLYSKKKKDHAQNSKISTRMLGSQIGFQVETWVPIIIGWSHPFMKVSPFIILNICSLWSSSKHVYMFLISFWKTIGINTHSHVNFTHPMALSLSTSHGRTSHGQQSRSFTSSWSTTPWSSDIMTIRLHHCLQSIIGTRRLRWSTVIGLLVFF